MSGWLACAEYDDKSSIRRIFEYDSNESESDQQHKIEEWLLTRKSGCNWYSVDYFADVENYI